MRGLRQHLPWPDAPREFIQRLDRNRTLSFRQQPVGQCEQSGLGKFIVKGEQSAALSGAQRGSALYLDGRQCIGRFNDKVHLHASRRPPCPQPGIARCVAPRGQVLIDQSLAGCADGIGHGARCVVRAEGHGDAGIGEVELRLRRQCATRRPLPMVAKTLDRCVASQ